MSARDYPTRVGHGVPPSFVVYTVHDPARWPPVTGETKSQLKC
jgi:hypothetical protein